MKTERSGVSAGNIHINKLANIAKNHFILKLFYILFILLGMQSAYADELSFDFIYSSGIESVYFDQTNMKDRYTVQGKFTVTPSSISNGYQLTVNTGINSFGSNSATYSFNKNYPRMQLRGSESTAYDLDFWFSGVLYINGHALSTESYTFTLAHENHKSSNSNWWIADTSGNASLYESGNSVAMTVKDDIGNYYCLSQNGTNYQVVVTSGMCNQNPIYPDNWTNEKSKKFRFEYESGIESMSFIYDGVSDDIHHNEEYLKAVVPSTYKNGYEVTVISKLDADTGTAASFIHKFNSTTPQNNILQMNSEDLSIPEKLYFWVEGSLYINNKLVASDFTLAYDEHGKWWIGSINGNSIINNIPEMQLDGYCFIIKQGLGDAGSDDNWSVQVTAGTCPFIDPKHGFGPVG